LKTALLDHLQEFILEPGNGFYFEARQKRILIGQLNTYLNFFKEEISSPDDNPPAGILLVAEKDHALVKYATAGMDENLFVQKYLVKLPGKNQLERYIEKKLKKLK